jgi:hypothetical protein
VTTYSAAAADTAKVQETVMEAGLAVADLIAEETPKGKFEVQVARMAAGRNVVSPQYVRTPGAPTFQFARNCVFCQFPVRMTKLVFGFVQVPLGEA